MTDHNTMTMKHANRQVRDKELIKAMLDQCPVCTLAMHDEPYPYEVPLNFGYEWEDKLVIYMHMAIVVATYHFSTLQMKDIYLRLVPNKRFTSY